LTVFLIKRVPLKRADDAQRKLDGKAWLQGEKARKAAEREKVGAVKVPPRDHEASQLDHGLEVGRREMQR
jgi:hypothetical protein